MIIFDRNLVTNDLQISISIKNKVLWKTIKKKL